jgi:hypothetical protein
MSPHDRTDRRALVDWIEGEARWQDTPDLHALSSLDGWFSPLVGLADFRSAPVDERIAAATTRLRSARRRLNAIADRLESPRPARVLTTVSRLRDAGEYLKGYAALWKDAPPGSVETIAAAADSARHAVDEVIQRLEGFTVSGSDEPIGIGRANVEVVLRVRHHLPFGARTVYRTALAELREADDALRALGPAARGGTTAVEGPSPDAAAYALRDAAGRWIDGLPGDEGLRIAPIPRIWAHSGAAALYADAGEFLPAGVGLVYVQGRGADARTYANAEDAVEFRHELAHEAYPGHRLEAVRRRAACRLRRFVDDRVFVEGWAVYAEDVLHETGACAPGPTDDFVRASRRAGNAKWAMFCLLTATGAATPRELVDLAQRSGWRGADLEWVGENADLWIYSLNYLVGRDEIRRLRRIEEDRLGAAFDLRAFHAKLLAEGPIPPRLIEEEWAAGAK